MNHAGQKRVGELPCDGPHFLTDRVGIGQRAAIEMSPCDAPARQRDDVSPAEIGCYFEGALRGALQ
jgi:hypothetical protein